MSVARRLASVAEAAAYAHVHRDTVYRLIRDERLTAYRPTPRATRVDLDELDELMLSTPAAPAPAAARAEAVAR